MEIEYGTIPNIRQVAQAVYPWGFVAGGAARYWYHREEAMEIPSPGDIDVFLRTEEGDLITSIGLSLQEIGYHYIGDKGNAGVWQDAGPDQVRLPIQVIHPIKNAYTLSYGTPQEVLSHFGFRTDQYAIIATKYADGWIMDGLALDGAEEDTLSHRLTMTGHITCPVNYVTRAVKYGRKGYNIPLVEALELFKEWDLRPPEWKATVMGLAELGDVDALYRMMRVD